MKKEIIKPTLVLLLVTLFSAAVIGVTHAVTLEPIQQQRANAEMAAITALFPHTYTTERHAIEEESSSLTGFALCFDRDNKIIGYVFSASPAGYSGRIHMMVALDYNAVVQGIRIINHTETPGLGSNITQGWFIGAFPGQSGMMNANDVPVVTGATVSVNAVLRGVNDAIAYMKGSNRL
ncbi:MAG: FMN-binding protein [Defluviitaleaceae bacterium]|nr:FMN-binding protein [Defluviitaleaceae bacterium]